MSPLHRNGIRSRDAASKGFTLIEVLIALVVVATSLAAMGALIATTVRGARSIERRLTQIAAVRMVTTALPNRDELTPGSPSGNLAGNHWRLDIAPFASQTAATSSPWVPQTVVITVTDPTGGAMQVATVRLHRKATAP